MPDTDAPKGRPVPFILAEGYTPTRAGIVSDAFHLPSVVLVLYLAPVVYTRIYMYISLKSLGSSNKVLLVNNFLLKDRLNQIILFSEVSIASLALRLYYHKDQRIEVWSSRENLYFYHLQ